MREDSKTRVVVLGGGVSGMTAAFELTATPELRERYDVTVYQMGWRLGGKGASGRNMQRAARIEEHGLHIWFGFYDNAFALMRRCYEELDRPEDAPLATVGDAFKPASQIVLCEHYDDKWLLWPFDAPRNPLEPGTMGVLPTLWEIVADGLELASRGWSALADDVHGLGRPDHGPSHWPALVREACEAIGDRIEAFEVVRHQTLLDYARRLARHLAGQGRTGSKHHLLCRLMVELKKVLWDDVVKHHVDHDYLRIFFTMFDTMVTIVVGMVEDNIVGNGFDSINELELREWLAQHGALKLTLDECPLIWAWYDAAFAYEDGDKMRPNMAAGTAVHGLLRILGTYKGAISFKMQAGMGDTIFAPMYEVLCKRGVHFEFFRRVTNLGLTASRTEIGRVDVVHQAEVTRGAYKPLLDVRGLPSWVNEPDWSQLDGGDTLRADNINFEYGMDAPGAITQHLELGTDFDVVVLAIPVAALPAICGELLANRDQPRFTEMVAKIPTVMTQAFQVWLKKPEEGLGWKYERASILTSYHEPLDTYCDMHQLLAREQWLASDDVQSIAYFCGVMKDEPDDTQQAATDRAHHKAVKFLNGRVGPLWPHADRDDPGSPSTAFDWDLLVDRERAVGSARFESQYWRANFQPTERYVQSFAGTIKYRLPADQSGYENLILAGDWVKNGIDGGCVEASVMAGMQASRAICGEPEWIVGEDASWLEGREH